MLSRQNFVYNSYIKFRENPVNTFVADSGRQTGRGIDRELHIVTTHGMFLYFKIKPKVCVFCQQLVFLCFIKTTATVSLKNINPLNLELNPICYLQALLAHHFLHVSRIRVKSLTLRLPMSYIYGAPILDVSRSHTTTQHSR